MKYFYSLIIILIVFYGWIYNDNQKKLQEHTKGITALKTKTLNQDNLLKPAPIANQVPARDLPVLNQIPIQDPTVDPAFKDVDNSYLNATSLEDEQMIRADNYRELSSQDADQSAMDVGPSEIYVREIDYSTDYDVVETPQQE